jgi:energy-coupling factor transporter ATP-binding protein EcfA2
MLTIAATRPAFLPRIPERLEDLDISPSLVMDLILRRVYVSGQSSLIGLSEGLKLSPQLLETVFRDMRQQLLVEVKGMVGNDYQFGLSQAGKALAAERYQITHYAGVAPVSLKQYHRAAKAQAARIRIDRAGLKKAFADLVVPDSLLDKVGPALISQDSVFLYGPTGSGKTSIAERMLRAYSDAILVPYAVEVDGQIIQLFDPVVHEQVENSEFEYDPRWVLCRRPCVVVGGELAPGMLELKLDDATGIYAAPLQMKANNGVFVIDDFGRQLIAPRELLNRWIVPLDRRVDYLSLRYGVKFQIPFEMLVVFSTNLNPLDLADEAFLRRIQNKILVPTVEPEHFDEIFRRVALARNLPCEPDSAAYLRSLCAEHGELRACHPADICKILISISTYEGRTPRVTKADLERAVAQYFTQQ